MKIRGLQIDGFGVWTGLKISGLSDGLNVLYGPNEAGKTTLMQFVRAVLYGFAPRHRYLPPIHGGRSGGSVELSSPSGGFHLDRHRDQQAAAGDPDRLVLTAADGTRQGEHMVTVLLANVDEPIFNNVFAVGLREIQELGTLSDTEAAQSLYSLTAGLDRISLVEVMRELETSRNRILDAHGGPCRVVELLGQRETMRQEIEELEQSSRRYVRLMADQELIQREIAQREEERTARQTRARVIELATTLGPRWKQRAALDEQLSTLGTVVPVPQRAVQRLDAINARLGKRQQRIDQLHERRQQLRRQAAELKISEPLMRQSARIEALNEQQTWIAGLEARGTELEAEIAELDARLTAERQALGLGDRVEPTALAGLSSRTIRPLRPAAKELRRHRSELAAARQAVEEANQTADSLERQIETVLAARQQRDLAEALDQAGNLVAQLRRRVQIDERLDEMNRYERELDEQSRQLVDRQILPVWVLVALGGAFVLGVVLVMAGLFMPTSMVGSLGWAMALLGLAGAGAAGGLKIALERSNAQHLEACQKQLGMLQKQIETTKDERESLDRQLPRGGGPLVSRLDAAEKELASLEELLPVDARRMQARQEAQMAAARIQEAEQHVAAARRVGGANALERVGLPSELAPKQVRRLTTRSEDIGQLQRQIELRREELDQRRGELESVCERIRLLVDETQVHLSGDRPTDQLRQLAEAVAQQQQHVTRREQLRQEARQARRRQARQEAAVAKLKRLRRELLSESSARDEQEFRRRAVEAARVEVLRRDRDALAREIAAAIGDTCSEDAVGRELETESSVSLEERWEAISQEIEFLDQQLQERFERRGQIAEQLKVLADDRRLANRRLDLAVVEQQLEDAVRQWQVLAVTCSVLERIREIYEKQRQPETLQEASVYLNRLTDGRYPRVWTPLGEQVLRVDDAEGNSLPVEVLSRGTREQLFLSLRLALAASYARRGAALPLVLDDVLVNFDAARAKAAAAVLRDFAAEGHQVLVFTCHEHIVKLFKTLKVPVSSLPENSSASPEPITFESATRRTTSSRTRKKATPPPKPSPPQEDEEEDDVPFDVAAEEDDEEELDDDASSPEGDEYDEEDYDEDEEDLEVDDEEDEDDSLYGWDDEEEDDPAEAA